jgi:hypothetical protein
LGQTVFQFFESLVRLLVPIFKLAEIAEHQVLLTKDPEQLVCAVFANSINQ